MPIFHYVQIVRISGSDTFARESQIDIMAAQAGIDSLEFRLKNLSDKKMVRVLKAAAEKFDWVSSKPASGRGYGISCGIDAGTYVATIGAIDLDKKTGQVQVTRVICVQDMGISN